MYLTDQIKNQTVLTGDELIFNRYNDYYVKNEKLWKKAIDAYNGGSKYIDSVLSKHPSETEEEFESRKSSTYYLNLIKYSVKEFGNYIFSKPPRRRGALKTITDDFDYQRKHVNEVMWQLFNYHTLCGLVWALVDMPEINGNMIDLDTKRKQKIRPWCKVLSPLSVVDWCFDKFGGLEWVIIEKVSTKKENPFLQPVKIKKRTLYTKEYYQVFSKVIDSPYTTDVNQLEVSERKVNSLGVVPVMPYSDILYNKDFNVPEIADVLTITDAVLKAESELLTNILKQTYGQLVLPMSSSAMVGKIKAVLASQGIDVNSVSARQLISQELGIQLSRTKAIYEDDQERSIARYIQPTGATTQSIIDHDDRLIQLTMKMTGFLTGIASTQRSSAESKAVDNASLAAQLIRIANKLQEFEINLWTLFNAFDSTIKVPSITYNKDFDIHELNAVIAGVVELSNINAGDSFKKQFQRTATHVMDSIHRIPEDVYEDIMDDIEKGAEATAPAKFEEQPTYSSSSSGSRPDAVKPISDYRKGTTNNVGKTETIKQPKLFDLTLDKSNI